MLHRKHAEKGKVGNLAKYRKTWGIKPKLVSDSVSKISKVVKKLKIKSGK